MLRSDFLIHNEVRRELTRTQVSLEKIQFGVTRGVVYLRGEFRVQIVLKALDRKKYYDVLISTLIGLEKRLRRVPGIVDIVFQFTNIQKYGGFWRPPATKLRSRRSVYVVVQDNGDIIEEEEGSHEKGEESQ